MRYLKKKNDSQIKNIQQIHKKTKRRGHKHNTKENHQTTIGKTKRKRKEQRRNTKSTGNLGLKW